MYGYSAFHTAKMEGSFEIEQSHKLSRIFSRHPCLKTHFLLAWLRLSLLSHLTMCISLTVEKYGKEFALTAANFTFMRRPIGVAEGEVFRSASVQRGRASAAAAARKRGEMFDEPSPKKSRPKRQKPEIVIERDSDDVNVTSLLAAESPILTSHLMSPVSSQGVSPVIVTPVTVRSASGTPVRVVTPVRTLTPGRTVTPVRPVSRTSISGTDSHEDADAETNSGKTNAKKESKGTVTTEEIKHGGEKVEMLFPSSEAVIISPPKKKFKSTARKSTTQKYFRKPKPK